MQFIDDAKNAWRLFSVQLGALAVAFGSLPADTQNSLLQMANVPQERVPAIIGALFIVARLVSQKKE